MIIREERYFLIQVNSEETSEEEATTQSVLPFWMVTTQRTIVEPHTTLGHEEGGEEEVHSAEKETENDRNEHVDKPVTQPIWHATTTPGEQMSRRADN